MFRLQRVTIQSSGISGRKLRTRGPGQGVRGMGMSGATSADRRLETKNRGANFRLNQLEPCVYLIEIKTR